MNRTDVYACINNFAPPELAESWDCSGVIVENSTTEIKKVMLALTVTDEVIEQALKSDCDMIISHHPLFFAPLEYKRINIFCAHTNLDKADGGTTDTLVERLGLECSEKSEFLRYCDVIMTVEELAQKLKNISPNMRYVNNKNTKTINRIAFCAGSGAEFINEAKDNGADAYVTGDLKFHPALESDIVVYDIGHFESEIQVLKVLEKLLCCIDVVYAREQSPFLYC